MALCSAKTKRGSKCSNTSQHGTLYCHVYKGLGNGNRLASTVIGSVLGNLFAPGIGGLVIGGVLGATTNPMEKRSMTGKTRVFVSFDFDNDKKLKEFIIGQSKLPSSPFSVIDHSLKEAAPEHNWKAKARTAIKRSDIVLVMVGPQTHRAPGVLAEVAMAREEGKRIVQVIGYKDGNYTAVPNAGRLYRWSWENMKKLLG